MSSSLSSQKNALFAGSRNNKTAAKSKDKALEKANESEPVTVTAPAAPLSKTAHLKPMTMSTTSSSTISVSLAMRTKHMTEARSLSERGMNFLKTSMFQWTPDHLGGWVFIVTRVLFCYLFHVLLYLFIVLLLHNLISVHHHLLSFRCWTFI